MIYGDIYHQQLNLISSHAVADTINYLEMKFNFKTSDWDGLEKWAHFRKEDLAYDIPLTDDQIHEEDHLNLTSGIWEVYLHGNKFEDGNVVKRVTTNIATLEIYSTGTLKGEPFPEIPASETERILARLEKVEQSGGTGGSGIDEDAVRYIESQTLRVGANVLTNDMVTLGAGWSGNLTDGFTHTSGTEPLVFAVGAADGESYIIEADYTSNVAEKAIVFSLGDSYETDPYNGKSHLVWGLTCVGDDGALKITPASNYSGKITNLTFRKVTEDGENEVEIELGDIYHTDMPNHLAGPWNIAMGKSALTNSVNGTRNIALGRDALALLKSGGRNIGIGTYAMSKMESGENNIAVGSDSLFLVKKASDCIAFGKAAMAYGAEYSDNIAIGTAAMYGGNGNNTTSRQNIALGNQAGYYGGGTGNVFIGTQAGYKNANNLNTFIGQHAGKEATGYSCTAIGNQATTNGHTQSTAIGQAASTTKSKQVVIGADYVVETLVKGDLVVRGTDGVKRQIVFNADGTCSWTEV